MKKIQILSVIAVVCFVQMVMMSGCSTRQGTPVIDQDSTRVWLPKHDTAVNAHILLCRKISKKSGRLIDVGNEFNLGEKESVKAFVKLDNRFFYGDKELMFHFDWIDQDGNSFFMKKIFLTAEDTASSIFSSVSMSPESRQPGDYLFRVYFFRELIAEKQFKVLPADTTPITNDFTANINFCKKLDKKTGELIDQDTVFEIKEKGRITAVVDLRNRKPASDKELLLELNWIGPDGKSFYSKEIDLNPNDTVSKINSSVSAESRSPGSYLFRISIDGEILGEENFSLIPEIKVSKPVVPSINAQIALSKGVDKNTDQQVNIDSVFNINKKGKIHAFAKLQNRKAYAGTDLKLTIDWIGNDGKSFYKKQIEISANDTTSIIRSAISISPETRLPGNYQVKVVLSKKVIGIRKFRLVQ